MKKALKVVLVVILLCLAILIILPFAFKGKIMNAVKNAANDNLNAKVEFTDISISLIRNFPNLSVRIDDLSIEGVDGFKNDTLVAVPELSITINIMSVIKGDTYEVKKVAIDNARVYLKVLADGRANWDIMKEDTTKVDEVTEPSEFKMSLSKFTFSNGFLVYDDVSLNTFVTAKGINHSLQGDLSADVTELDTQTDIDTLYIDYENIRYINRARASLDSKITADLVNNKFTFPDAHLRVNELELLAKGYFSMPEEGYTMDIAFEAIANEFRNFLSMVPAIYAKNFDKIIASGTLGLNGYVKGKYSENTMPSFGINFDISEGRFKYPDLPGAVENINLKARVKNETGEPDATIIDVDEFHVEIMQNPIDAVIHVRTPVSDPYIDATVKGRLDLADVSKIYPMDQGDQLAGLLVADIAVKGNQSDAEAQRFNEFDASGQFSLSDIKYNTSSFKDGVSISKALFNLSPANIAMPEMQLTIGKNDISGSGNITNYIAYAFDKGELRGNLNINSNYFNVNDFTSDQVEADTAKSSMTVIEIPKNIDFTLASAFDKIIYDKLELTNATGILKIKDQQLTLQNLKFNTLDGQMIINGSYATRDPERPAVDLQLSVINIDVQETFKSFVTVEKLAPIARLTSGEVSSSLNFSSILGKDMMPQPLSFNGKGNLTSQSLVINNAKILSKLASALKMDQFKTWALNKLNLSFEMVDGKVFVKPFNAKLGNITAEIAGWNSFDQKLEYVLELAIPRSAFGGAANDVLNNLVSQANSKGANFSLGETVPVTVLISGNVSDPQISTSIKSVKANLMEGVKETIQKTKEQAVTKVKEEASKYIEEANLKAQKLLDEAQVKADKLVSTAQQSAQRIKDEANKKAEQLVVEGKKKGMIGELAATKAAERVKSEGDKQGNAVIVEAQKQADALMATAKQQADKIVNDAKAKAN